MRRLLPLIFILHKLCTAAAPPAHIRVRMLELQHPKEVQVRAGGPPLALKASTLALTRVEGPLELIYGGQKARLRGALEASPAGDGSLLLVLDCSLEDYVLGVTASEIGDGRDVRAYVRALAATVMRYTTLHKGRHKKKGYDFCDNTHCQVFRGLPPDEKKFTEMLEGLKRWKRGGGFFQRCCGGILEPEETVWGKENGKSLRCELKGEGLCAKDNFYRWDAAIPLSHWLEAASLASKAEVADLKVKDRTPAGRIRLFEAATDKGAVEIDAWKFYSEYGKRFGWADLHSLWFEFKAEGENVNVEGRGLGHGAGLCQSGALELARKGWSETQILNFYFPK